MQADEVIRLKFLRIQPKILLNEDMRVRLERNLSVRQAQRLFHRQIVWESEANIKLKIPSTAKVSESSTAASEFLTLAKFVLNRYPSRLLYVT